MDNKLPLRLKVLSYINTVPETTLEKTMHALKPEYGSERQFTEKNFMDHFLSLKENGLIDDIDYDLSQDNSLIIHYAINELGKSVLQQYGK